MERKRILSFLLAFLLSSMFTLPFTDIQAAEKTDTLPERYTNYLSNYIPDVDGTCRTSFLGKTSDGGYQVVIYYEEKLLVKNFTAERQLRETKEIDLELPIWGGVYLGAIYNYVVCGKSYDANAENGGEVYRIIKYNKNFQRIKSLSLNSKETYTASPFSSGNVSMDESGKILTIYTSRLRPDWHQSNIAIHINTADMAISNNLGMIPFPSIHASHSFRQIIKYDNDMPVYVDLSDSTPKRSVYIQNQKSSASLMDIDGEDGNNVTSAEVTGLAISDRNYLVTGTYLNQEMSNVFLSCLNKESGEVQKQWLTDSFPFKVKCVHHPKITKIGTDRFAVMWGTSGFGQYMTNYVFVDGTGTIVSELKEIMAPVTDCEPIYENGKIVWVSAKSGILDFHEITDFSENGVYQPKTEPVQAQNPWDGTADTSWYEDGKTEFDITTASQLAGLAQLVNGGNAFEGKKINLCNDIFLNDESYRYQWEPIALCPNGTLEGANAFQGNFNGNKHAIYNMRTEHEGGSLFGYIGENGRVKSVDVSQGLLNSGGCIANVNKGIISFCNNYSCAGNSEITVGGVCNANYNLVYGCKNYGEVWGRYVGGIVGINAEAIATVSQCSNHGLVGTSSAAAGIVCDNFGWIYNCYNKGVIADAYLRNEINRGRWLNGIVYNNGNYIRNCYSAGSFSYSENNPVYVLSPIAENNQLMNDGIKNCYFLSVDNYTLNGTTAVSLDEMLRPDFVEKLDLQTDSVLSVWRNDGNGINNSLPVPVAELSYASGQCKIQPEAWIRGGEKTIEVYLENKEYNASFTCYFNDEAPVVTIENTEIAEPVEPGSRKIKLKKQGITNMNLHFKETENNSSADYQLILKVVSKEEQKETNEISDLAFGKIKNQAYTGKAIKPGIQIKDGSEILSENVDYELSYQNNVNAGTATVKIIGIGNYTGTVKKTFTITPQEINEQDVSLSKKSYPYNGKSQKPSVTVKSNQGNILKNGMDYTVSYEKGRKNVGKYKVSIKLKGNYTGTLIKTFTIKPKATSISRMASKKKGFIVKWKKQTIQTTGYQLQYSTSSKFAKKNTKALTLKKNRITSRTVTKLKAGKKYYVRVRAYKNVKVNGKTSKIYSDWSKAKKVTTRK